MPTKPAPSMRTVDKLVFGMLQIKLTGLCSPLHTPANRGPIALHHAKSKQANTVRWWDCVITNSH